MLTEQTEQTDKSLAEYEAAQEALKSVQDKIDRYSGNNPDKYQSELRSALREVRALEQTLKANGTIPRSPEEELFAELDARFPDARSKEVVEHNGIRYMRRFFPLEKSRSRKTVKSWGKIWERCDSQ